MCWWWFSDKHCPVPTENINGLRKDMFSPLLGACDDVREQLASANIQIKVPSHCVLLLFLCFLLTAKMALQCLKRSIYTPFLLSGVSLWFAWDRTNVDLVFAQIVPKLRGWKVDRYLVSSFLQVIKSVMFLCVSAQKFFCSKWCFTSAMELAGFGTCQPLLLCVFRISRSSQHGMWKTARGVQL